MINDEKFITLIDYLKLKTEEQDWHAVSDAANDLRVLEAKYCHVCKECDNVKDLPISNLAKDAAFPAITAMTASEIFRRKHGPFTDEEKAYHYKQSKEFHEKIIEPFVTPIIDKMLDAFAKPMVHSPIPILHGEL